MENKKYNWYRIDFIIMDIYEETHCKVSLIKAESEQLANVYLKQQLRKNRIILWSIVSVKEVILNEYKK